MIGTAFCALTAGLAWATQRPGVTAHAHGRVR
jgi:hypothetical protein